MHAYAAGSCFLALPRNGRPRSGILILELIDQLEQVVTGELKRFAFFMPPGSAESFYGSIIGAMASSSPNKWR